MLSSTPFRLKVQKIEQVCLFELSWGQEQQLMATLPYPVALTRLYQDWQRYYLNFYQTASLPIAPMAHPNLDTNLRGWTIGAGSSTATPVDWHSQLVEAEVRLLHEFHVWLRSAELYEIRATIACHRPLGAPDSVNVFLTCSSELARFPWEAWEIGTDFTATGKFRIVRTPATIRTGTGSRLPKQRRRARILAILGDDTGLNFEADQAAVRSLSRVAEVKFIGWQPGQTPEQVIQQIQQGIADEAGWDGLFFAGHSNETQVTGGELAIAPGVSISICEIAAQLTTAKEKGLQFAIFNSCSGLSIAASLIDLGFSQVAVMREPIHNRVAEEFLVQLVRYLADHKNIQEALLETCQFLRSEKGFTYPSAHLVPALFCHPGAELFQISPFGWKERLRQLVPQRIEAIGLAACLMVGLFPPISGILLDQRIALQATYRDLTQQVPPATLPPVALVQIDEASVVKDSRLVNAPAPISRHYLADLIAHLTQRNAKVIGIDYLLDRPVDGRETLVETLQAAVKNHQTWFVFAALAESERRSIFVAEQGKTAERTWSLQGHVMYWETRYPSYVTLPYADEPCHQLCPFAYLLSLIDTANHTFGDQLPQPHLDHQQDLRTQLLDFVEQQPHASSELQFLQQTHLSHLSSWVDKHLQLIWWQPLIDFSIPPDRIYTHVAAWRLLEDDALGLPLLSQQIVIIGAGDYDDPDSMVQGQLDYYPAPSALNYWRQQLSADHSAADSGKHSPNFPDYQTGFTGAEAHAYMVHHLLNQHLVFAMPYLWMVGLTGLLGKGTTLILKYRQRHQAWTRKRKQRYLGVLLGTTVGYGLVSLQLYVAIGLLLPWLFPSILYWMYIFPALNRRLS